MTSFKTWWLHVVAIFLGVCITPQLAHAGFNFEFQEFGKYTLSVEGGGSHTADNYNITLNKPSPTATVYKAYAIATTIPEQFGGSDPGVGALTLTTGALTVTPNLSNVDSSQGSPAYARWAEITSDLSTTLDALPAGGFTVNVRENIGNSVIDGAAIFVVWNDPTANPTLIAFKLGVERTSDSIDLVINTAPINTTNPLFQAEFGIGITFSTATGSQINNVSFEGTQLSSQAGGYDDGTLGNGGLVSMGGDGDTLDPTDEDERYDVTNLITNNETSLNINVNSTHVYDYLFAVWFSGRAVEPPAVVQIDTPVDGAQLTAEPTVSGISNANGMVVVTWRDSNNQVIHTVTVPSDNAGAWSATPRGLSDGQYTVSASITVPSGTATDSAGFEIDTMPPVIAITTPADGSSTNDTTPTISGTGEDGVPVAIELLNANGMVIETLNVTPNAQGTWSIDAAALPDGDYTITAESTDAFGNTGTTGPIAFTVDTILPTIAINTPADGAITNNNTPNIAGMAENGATVEVVITDENGAVVQTLPATNNGAWSADAAALADGDYTITATATDAAGNVATDGPRKITIDTSAPAVTIATPADGTSTNDNTPTLSGTSEPGATFSVEVRDDANMVVQSFMPMVDAQGAWSVDAAMLVDGDYTVVATATDTAGNATSVTNSFSVDTTAPNLTLATPTDGMLTNNSTPAISGTGDAGETVNIEIADANGQVVQTLTTTVDPQGMWSVMPMMLADGTYSVSATSTDAAGNAASAGPASVTIDSTAPVVSITAPADNSTSNNNTPTITGGVEPGAMLMVTINDANGTPVQVLTTMVDAAGAWTGDATQLADGTYTIEAVATDAAGNMSTATSTVTIDTVAPVLVLSTPADGSATNDDTPTIAGTNDAGVDVSVEILDANGQVVFTGTAPTDANGAWTLDSTQLPEGAYTVNASSTDAAGNNSTQSAGFTIDTTAPTVAIDAPADMAVVATRDVDVTGTSEPNVSISVELRDDQGVVLDTAMVTADANGAWTATFQGVANGAYVAEATAADAANNTATDDVNFSVDSDEPNLTVDQPLADAVLSNAKPDISGTTDVDSSITIVITDAQGAVVETLMVTPDANGAWSSNPTQDLADGDYTVSVTATRPNGKSTTIDRNVTIDTTVPTTVITTPADGSTSNMGAVVVAGTSEPGAMVKVTLTDDAGNTVFETTVTTDDQGAWTADAGMLGDGTYNVAAEATDAAGNTADATPTTFTIDTSAPTVTITSPTAGEEVADLTPTITGTAEPGAVVDIFVDGNKVGEATADATGNWTFDVTDPLTEGDHTIEAKTTNGAGVEGSSGTITITVKKPGADVVITSPTEGSDVTGPSIVVTGTGEPGDEVTVTINGETQTVTVDDNGDWTATFDNVPSGDTTVTAKSGDKESTVTVKVVDPAPAAGFTVTGGPGCSAAPGQGSPSWPLLLIVGLGFIGLRRRQRA